MKKILIIDDDIHIGDMLEEVLRKEGYGVLRAYSGTEALLRLDTCRPDLVLLDLMLPGLSGEAVLPKISIGQLALALGEGAVAPVPLAVPRLYLVVSPPLLRIVLIDIRLEGLVGVLLYGHVGTVWSFQPVDDNHIVLDKLWGHIRGDGTDAVNVKGVLGGQSAYTHACGYFHNNSPLYSYLFTDNIDDE